MAYMVLRAKVKWLEFRGVQYIPAFIDQALAHTKHESNSAKLSFPDFEIGRVFKQSICNF